MSTGSLKIKQGATGPLATTGYSVLWASTSGMAYLNQPDGSSTPIVGSSGTSGVSGTSGTSGVSGSSGTSGVNGLGLSAKNIGVTGANFVYSGAPSYYYSFDWTFDQPFNSTNYSVDFQFKAPTLSGFPYWFDLSSGGNINILNKTASGFTIRFIDVFTPNQLDDLVGYVQAIATGETGVPGQDGTNGTSGTSGVNGSSGIAGTSGTSGTSGVSQPAGLVPGTGTKAMKNEDSLVTTAAVASGNCSIAIGNASCAATNKGIAIGNNITTCDQSGGAYAVIAVGNNISGCSGVGDAIMFGSNLSSGAGGLTGRPVVLFGCCLNGSGFGSVVSVGANNQNEFTAISFGANQRAGESGVSVGWNNASAGVGNNTQLFGNSNQPYGKSTAIMVGFANDQKSQCSVTIGAFNSTLDCVSTGSHNTIIGFNNTNPSNVANPMSCNTVIGYGNTTCGNNSGNTVIGVSNTAGSFNQLVLGSGNVAQGDNATLVGNSNGGSEQVVGIGFNNCSNRGYVTMVGYQNRSTGGGQCHTLIGVNNDICGFDSETSNRAGSVAIGMCNTVRCATRTVAIGSCNQLIDSCGRNSHMIGNENIMYAGATGSSFVGNSNIGATGICNAYVHGNGITTKVSDHFHTTNLFLTNPLGPYASDACFYAAGGITGQAYMLDHGSHTNLTIAGFN